MEFRCAYCVERFELFKNVIEHCISSHAREPLKYRFLSLNDKTGKKCLVSRGFGVIPKAIEDEGKTIIAIRDHKIQVDDAVDLHSTEDSKNTEQTKTSDEQLSDKTPAAEETACSRTNQPSTSTDAAFLQVVQELLDLVEQVAETMESLGLLKTWLAFHKMVAEKTFPTDNMSFRLFMDVVRFYQCPSTTKMTYTDNVKLFWQTGARLFHHKFLRFMSGPKNQGQIVDGSAEKGFLNPLASKVNFAVPKAESLKSKQMIEGTLQPGVLHQCVDAIAKETKQIKISFDGKRINSCLSQKHGDVDLFGCETSPTYMERRERKSRELQVLEDMVSYAEANSLHTSDIHNVIRIISVRIKELRQISCMKKESLDKLKTLAGPDWKQSKYSYVISSLHAALYEIGEVIKSSLGVTDRLCQIAAGIHGTGHLFHPGMHAVVDLGKQANYVCITEGSQHSFDKIEEVAGSERNIVKQKSPAWFAIRESVAVTGSCAHRALGLGTFKEQVQFYDEKFLGKTQAEPSDLTKKRMQHGTQNEPNALATLVGKVLPAYYPEIQFIEEGCISLKHEGQTLMVISPDGSGRESALGSPKLAFEFKCPCSDKHFVPQVHYKVPEYYVIQLLAEMAALGCTSLLFMSYTKESSTVFKIEHDEELWKKIVREVQALYGENTRKRPSRPSQIRDELKEDICTFSSDKVTFVCELPSATAILCEHTNTLPDGSLHSTDARCGFASHVSQNIISVPATGSQDLSEALRKSKDCIEGAHNMTRKQATELFVFMASDLDRIAGQGCAQSLSIAYGLQGPSLTTEVTRKMLQTVLAACHDRGLQTLAFSCDGQWVNLITKDLQGKPLTRLQLQKSFWDDVKKIPKKKLDLF